MANVFPNESVIVNRTSNALVMSAGPNGEHHEPLVKDVGPFNHVEESCALYSILLTVRVLCELTDENTNTGRALI